MSLLPNLTVIILTRDEEQHIERALASVSGVALKCYVIDSGSTDRTRELAHAAGATVLENPWVNYATQFNWALDQLPAETEWVLRLDADEYVTPELASEICGKLASLPAWVAAVNVSRRMHFLGKRIEWGGVFPIRVARLFRHRRGRCENRWMDEHIIFEGEVADFRGEVIDDNRNSLTWWTQKHNSYASREVVDLMNLEENFMESDTVADLGRRHQAGVKRWIKEHLYARAPAGARALIYFVYRYFLRFGFLDGREGTAFHFLQGFWYRYLVDAKMFEVRKYMATNNVDAPTAIERVLGIQLIDLSKRKSDRLDSIADDQETF